MRSTLSVAGGNGATEVKASNSRDEPQSRLAVLSLPWHGFL